LGKVWIAIITELLFKRLTQTTKHKCRFHGHFYHSYLWIWNKNCYAFCM